MTKFLIVGLAEVVNFRGHQELPKIIPRILFLGQFMKSVVYSQEINTRRELWQKIVNSANFISNQPNIFFKEDHLAKE